MLPVSRLVNVAINLSPIAAARRSFGVLNVAGDSNVISGLERFRTYSTYEAVAADLGTNAPESKAAQLYFGQTPKPALIMISRWLRTATSGFNEGGALSLTEQNIANFTGIDDGGLVIHIDGVTKTLTGLDFTGASNLNGVATIITTALSTSGVCTWDGTHFIVTSASTGNTSLVTAATAGSGTDISALLKLTTALLTVLVPGYAAETPDAYAVTMANKSSLWYGLQFAASVQPTDDQDIAVAGVIEALDLKRIFGVTVTSAAVLDGTVSSDLASRLKAGGYLQSFCQYSSTNIYAIASFFGRAFSVNFAANRSVINLMYKQEPLVVAEDLTDTQADVLESKRCNVFTDYVNDTMIIQYGVVSGPAWFDEIHGLDWFQDAVQNACFNLLYTSQTKIPQTDSGVNQLVNAISGACNDAVNNGLVAPGVWNADGFGSLVSGQYLKNGYYIYAQPVALQSQADREARIAPPIQVAIKLAGAIDTVDVIVSVNR